MFCYLLARSWILSLGLVGNHAVVACTMSHLDLDLIVEY